MSKRNPNGCQCKSCKAGLTCYKSDREVVDGANRTTNQLLYGDVLTLDPDAVRQRQPFEFAGTRFTPTRPSKDVGQQKKQ